VIEATEKSRLPGWSASGSGCERAHGVEFDRAIGVQLRAGADSSQRECAMNFEASSVAVVRRQLVGWSSGCNGQEKGSAMLRTTSLSAFFLGLSACIGTIGGDDETGPTISEEAANEVGATGLRRLSVFEFEQTLLDLTGWTQANARQLLPTDTFVPFDNDLTLQVPSEALIKGAEILAGDIADAIVADPTVRAKIVGCVPSGAADDACFRSFVETFGRRALRRKLSAEEVTKFAALSKFGKDANDFWVGVNAALRAFLQHPEFLYRVEIGSPVADEPGVHKLSDNELATRLSYFLIGSTTPDWLLDAVEGGELATADGVHSAAVRLMDDPRARARVSRFHALWLSYAQLSAEGIAVDMRAETDALLDRVIFDEKRSWTDLLSVDETFLSPALAEHYGMPSPGAEAAWVKYGDTGRKGLFSHGTFLSAVAKFGDTSPTQRGLLIRTRLFCQTIPKPDAALMVNVDMPPVSDDPNACKNERYDMWKTAPCDSCHKLMDPIGFGLENFNAAGQFRATEPDRPECVIDGNGSLEGVGTFNGPAELGALVIESGGVEECVARQLYRYAAGHAKLDEHDEALLKRIVKESSEGGLKLDAWMLGYVSAEAFRFRREENVQ
jgi:hypothetical protein